jgi:NarL family two-component system sensor histidine kinase YdfH
MKRIRDFFARTTGLWEPQSEWPFMLFLTFVFIFIYIWTVIASTRVREPLTLAIFTGLFIIHLVFHWIVIWWIKREWNTWLYLGIQAAIVFTLGSIAGELGALVGLYLGLIGEAVGMFTGSWPKKMIAVAGLLALSALNFYWVLPKGEILWWAVAILPMAVFVIIYVVLYGRQADARVKAQELLVELEAANRRLTESADQIEDLTLANERQRMARELHDTLAQGLAGLILQLEAVDSHLSQGHSEKAQAIVQQAMTRARATLAESRRAIDGLRKELPGSLAEALQAEAEHLKSTSGVPCRLEISLPTPVADEVQRLVVRIVSESLTNIARHAHARQASITLNGSGDMLTVEVNDDGIGFDAADGGAREGHYGLVGLRERVRLSGGTLEIRSAKGEGTRVKAGIPINPDGK